MFDVWLFRTQLPTSTAVVEQPDLLGIGGGLTREIAVTSPDPVAVNDETIVEL